jgi:hypothetical protein
MFRHERQLHVPLPLKSQNLVPKAAFSFQPKTHVIHLLEEFRPVKELNPPPVLSSRWHARQDRSFTSHVGRDYEIYPYDVVRVPWILVGLRRAFV